MFKTDYRILCKQYAPWYRNIMKKLEQNRDYEVIEYGCLGNCGECYLYPLAWWTAKLLPPHTVEELELRL